jgi:hypothetical protein
MSPVTVLFLFSAAKIPTLLSGELKLESPFRVERTRQEKRKLKPFQPVVDVKL